MDVDTKRWAEYHLRLWWNNYIFVTFRYYYNMNDQKLRTIFTDEVLADLFPAERTNDFFEALFGDADEGAYDIKLRYYGYDEDSNTLQFNLDLHERPGACLVCSLTYGLPEVFSRHPIINIKGLVNGIGEKLESVATCSDWKLGTTNQQEASRHTIPLKITLTEA